MKIKQAVIVEGKYDKIKLSSIIDGLIIETDGFSIFKSKAKLELLRTLAKTRGLIILTDSDSAGFKIRSYISGCIAPQYNTHAYIPDIFGKEKRKTKTSKEGKVGVEGIPPEEIVKALKRCGAVFDQQAENKKPITGIDLFEDGLSGGSESKDKRKIFLSALNLPERLSKNALLKVLNTVLTYEEYKELVCSLFLKDKEL